MSVRRVIVGVDRRESSEAALDWAVTETAVVGSVLVVAHAAARVMGASPARRNPGIPGGDPVLAWAVAVARRGLDPVRVQPVLRSGAAGGALVDLAFAEDILVLGAPTHRHWSGPRSATRYVLGHASCPVVVVPSRSSVAQRREGLRARGRPRLGCEDHVVVGVHRSEAARTALAFGFTYAARHRLPLAAVHVTGRTDSADWFDDQVPEAPLATEPAAARLLAEQLKTFEREYPRVAVRRLVLAGEVGRGLVTASDGATVLVSGAAEGGVGPVVHALVDHSVCPVAVVRRH
jgi:nucleotide-binding universal stress UspA family protein